MKLMLHKIDNTTCNFDMIMINSTWFMRMYSIQPCNLNFTEDVDSVKVKLWLGEKGIV